MTLRQLECFLAVAESGSFTGAAARVGITQPSLSQHVRMLEGELGGALLERLPRGVVLTAAGRALLPEARSAVTAAQRAARQAQAALGLSGGDLTIATVRSIAVGILPTALRSWHAAAPNITVHLREYRNRHLLEADVRSGIGDLAVGPQPTSWDGPVARLGSESFVVVLPPSDPLSRRRVVRLEELSERRWVLFEPDFGLTEVVNRACARAGFQPRAAVETAQSEAAGRLAAAGLGPAMVPENILPPGFTGPVARPDPPVTRELVAYTRSQWTEATASLVEELRRTPQLETSRDSRGARMHLDGAKRRARARA